jgi:hypothetical protein
MTHPKNPPRTALIDIKRYLTSAVIVGDGIARNLLDCLTKRPTNIPGINQSEPLMTLGNMRALGVRCLLVSCMVCRYEIAICVDRYADDIEVRSFRSCMKCAKCGSEDVQVRPNWAEAPGMPEDWTGRAVE